MIINKCINIETNEILKEIVENNLDENMATHKIAVNVIGGEVTLKGMTKSIEEKNNIEKIASKTFGVLSVKNELEIDNNI